MIRILTSRNSGSLWEALAETLKDSYHAGRKLVMLVPEQMTLQAEKDALEALKTKGFFRLQVMSPTRLNTLVFDRLGRDARTLIDERGQAMTLSRVLFDLRKDLKVYGRARNLPGFTRKLGEAIKEMKSAGLSPETLASWAEEQSLIDPKLVDLATLYQAYEQALSGQLADREDKDREMLNRLEEGRLFAGQDVLVYGFDLMSPPLIRLITTLAAQADNLHLALVCDRPAALDGAAFRTVYESLQALIASLKDRELAWEWDSLPQNLQGKPLALRHLEQQLLRLDQAVFEEAPQGLRLYAGKTPHEEIRRVAQLIHQELKAGADPRDLAIFYAGEAYAALLPGVLEDYGIPAFVAQKEPLLAQPLVRCLLDALKCVQSAVWRPQDVFSYLKSPFSPLNPKEAWELENYARAYGIRGRLWTQPFTRGTPETLEQAEALRDKAISPILRMRDRLNKAKTTDASLEAALLFLEELNALEQVSALEEHLLSLGLPGEAQRASQVWDQLMGLFEQMRQLLGGERIPMMRFALLLEAGLSMTELSALPPLQHCVQAGELGQLMVNRPGSVYILGLNSQALGSQGETLVDDAERKRLEKSLDLRLNLGLEEKESIRLLDLWKAMTAAEHRVHLSYALSDDQGQALAPLLLLGRLQDMFPKLHEEGGALYTLREESPLSPAVALDELATRLRDGPLSPDWQEALAFLLNQEETRSQAQALLDAARGNEPRKRLATGQAALMARGGAVSVSRLEAFAGCPFHHFVRYGLNPQPRKEWALEPTDVGSFCHAAVDGFTRRVKNKKDWPSMNRQQAEAEMDQVLSELTQGWEDAPWADTPRARRAAEKTLDICRRMAWALTEGRASSTFHTVASELRFGLGEGLPPIEIPLMDGSALRLRGTIDRVDTAVMDQDLKLLRVVDYKTGQTALNGGDVDAGAQLQLLLYLRAALDLLAADLPAGAFYQRMRDPLVSAENEDEALKASRNALRMDGVLLKDARVLKMMDGGDPPVTLVDHVKKSGEIKDSNRLLSAEELGSLMAVARQRTVELARSIFQGVVNRAPLIRANGRAQCAFCEYQGICRTEKPNREPLRRHSRKIDLRALAQESLGDDDRKTQDVV